MTVLQGPLADRDAWSAVGHCAIEKTMGLVGTKSAMLIMREAYYGTTRFDDFARRVGITKAATSARLSELVEAGLLTKQPYREPQDVEVDERHRTGESCDDVGDAVLNAGCARLVMLGERRVDWFRQLRRHKAVVGRGVRHGSP